MIAYDENRNPWLVLKGDPAYPVCSLLERKGFTEVVLPREAIVTGRVEEGQVPLVETIEALAVAAFEPTPPRLAQVYLNYMNLYDCTRYVVDSQA